MSNGNENNNQYNTKMSSETGSYRESKFELQEIVENDEYMIKRQEQLEEIKKLNLFKIIFLEFRRKLKKSQR